MSQILNSQQRGIKIGGSERIYSTLSARAGWNRSVCVSVQTQEASVSHLCSTSISTEAFMSGSVGISMWPSREAAPTCACIQIMWSICDGAAVPFECMWLLVNSFLACFNFKGSCFVTVDRGAKGSGL